MKAICADGTEIECENFKAIDSGVLLTKDRKRNKVIGFVPNDDLRYVVPDDAETEHEREGERERGELATLRERLDRLEARVDLSATDHTERAGRSVSTATIEERSRNVGTEREGGPGGDRSDTPDIAGAAAAEARAEPTPDSGIDLPTESGDAESGGEGRDGSERGANGTRTTASTTGTADIDADANTGVERERVGTSGFDPVAVVAEQREREGRSRRTERSEGEREAGADAETIDIGRSDPVATIARQGGESTMKEDEEERSASSTEDDRGEETDPEADLQRVDGLGPTYADRLTEGGIGSLADLEGVDPEDIASIAEVSESRAEEWIEQAGELSA